MLAQEDMADGDSTRLARRKVKKAVIAGQSCCVPYLYEVPHARDEGNIKNTSYSV